MLKKNVAVRFLLAGATIILSGAFNAIAQTTPNAQVCISVASLRAEPSHASELETQALMGTPVALGDTVGDWISATLPDGYSAYINRTAVTSLNHDEWKISPRVIAISAEESHIVKDSLDVNSVMSDFPLGCIVLGQKKPGATFAEVTLPSGERGFVKAKKVTSFKEWMNRPFDPSRVISLANSLTGVSYLWGGRTSKMIDCSGLTQLCFFDSGLMLPRNASAQARVGHDVPLTSLLPADLLFFYNERGKVVHVAIHKENSLYIHASGKVHTSSLSPEHPLYNGRTVNFARRPSNLPTVASHPWYF